MTDGVDGTILVINSGSSSVKFALFDMAADEPRRVWQGALERIGFDAGRFAATDVRGTILIDETLAIPNHVVALDLLLGWVEDRMSPKAAGWAGRLAGGKGSWAVVWRWSWQPAGRSLEPACSGRCWQGRRSGRSAALAAMSPLDIWIVSAH